MCIYNHLELKLKTLGVLAVRSRNRRGCRYRGGRVSVAADKYCARDNRDDFRAHPRSIDLHVTKFPYLSSRVWRNTTFPYTRLRVARFVSPRIFADDFVKIADAALFLSQFDLSLRLFQQGSSHFEAARVLAHHSHVGADCGFVIPLR